MQSFTIDASIALKWVSYENELHIDKAKQIFISGVKKKIILISPTILKAEVANILLKKKKLSVKNIYKALNNIFNSNIIFTELNDSLIYKALKLAEKYDLSVYDGIYLATSEFSKAPLISADEKGHGKVKEVIMLKNFKMQ